FFAPAFFDCPIPGNGETASSKATTPIVEIRIILSPRLAEPGASYRSAAADCGTATHVWRNRQELDHRLHALSEFGATRGHASLGHHQRFFVQHRDKASRVALGREGELSIFATGGDHNKRASCNKAATNIIDLVDVLHGRPASRRPLY